MKNIYKGEIINLNTKKDYDYIKIKNQILKKQDTYCIPLYFNKTCIYDNYILYEPVDTKPIVINYIKTVKQESKIGILKYREFYDIESLNDEIIFYEVYKPQDPFKITEYFDGVNIFLKMTDVKIPYKIYTQGYIEKISDEVYKIINYGENNIVIYQNNFYYTFVSKFKCKYEFYFLNHFENIQLKIFTSNLLDKYLKTDDIKKDEIIDLISNLNLKESLKFYDISKKDIIPRYTHESLYLIEDVIIFNIKKKRI